MRRFGLIVCFLGGIFAVLAAAGCGDTSPTPPNTAPNEKQALKESGPGGKGGGVSKGKM